MQLISTMATPLLVYGATAVFECIDASTDLPVTGVKIINPVIAGENLSGDANAAPAVPAGPFMLVPGPAA